jgi:hypothetical protein
MSEANPPSDTPSAAPLVVPLVGSHRLEVDTSDPAEHRLVLRLPAGGAVLRVAITAAGVQLELTGSDLALRASGELSIDADRVALHGRRGLALTSGGDVRIEASDDVCIDGERVKLNS